MPGTSGDGCAECGHRTPRGEQGKPFDRGWRSLAGTERKIERLLDLRPSP